eukprot:SAG31_NODE_1261_length_9072_cov_39.512761_4_plen_277_part_00
MYAPRNRLFTFSIFHGTFSAPNLPCVRTEKPGANRESARRPCRAKRSASPVLAALLGTIVRWARTAPLGRTALLRRPPCLQTWPVVTRALKTWLSWSRSVSVGFRSGLGRVSVGLGWSRSGFGRVSVGFRSGLGRSATLAADVRAALAELLARLDDQIAGGGARPAPRARALLQLHTSLLYCILLYCILLYCILLYCILLYCILYNSMQYNNLQRALHPNPSSVHIVASHRQRRKRRSRRSPSSSLTTRSCPWTPTIRRRAKFWSLASSRKGGYRT